MQPMVYESFVIPWILRFWGSYHSTAEGEMGRVLALLIACSAVLAPAHANGLDIVITDFNPWESMAGSVTGRSPAELQKFAVVIYAHAHKFKWYIHPLAGQGEGWSWAKIDNGGKWRINLTYRRENQFLNCIAALVVENPDSAPNEAWLLSDIDPHPITQTVRGLTSGHLTPNSVPANSCK
jgi:hypothetical protein